MAVDTSLSDRKLIILKAIIQNYLETGEPVGSRTLTKYTNLNLSSATIRNEMADLEDAVRKVKPMVDPNEIARFEKYAGVRGARNEESPSAPRREETNRDTGSAEVIFAAETIKILPGKLQTIEFFVPGKHDRIYLQLAGRHYACENHINNWSCSVDIKTAGEYEAVVSAEREICRKKLKFVKGVEENDLDI